MIRKKPNKKLEKALKTYFSDPVRAEAWRKHIELSKVFLKRLEQSCNYYKHTTDNFEDDYIN